MLSSSREPTLIFQSFFGAGFWHTGVTWHIQRCQTSGLLQLQATDPTSFCNICASTGDQFQFPTLQNLSLEGFFSPTALTFSLQGFSPPSPDLLDHDAVDAGALEAAGVVEGVHPAQEKGEHHHCHVVL